MIESAPLSWMFAGTALWFLINGLRPGSGDTAPGATNRISHLAHAAMAFVMSAMLWPMG